MIMPKCTIVIVNWNSWDILVRVLDKLQIQTYQNFNILVIDNASDQPIQYDLVSRYRNVTLIQNHSNLGFAAANNKAIELLDNCDWVALLNPDAFPEPDWLQRLIDAVEENPDCSIFASRQIMAGNCHLLDGDGDTYHISGLVWREGHGKHKDEATFELREIFSPCAAAALYRRDALISAGGFDENFFCYVEDVDLGFRLRLLGYRCLLVPSAVVHHVGSASTGGQHSDFSVYHGHRNLVWTFVKNMPGALFWLLLPMHILVNLVTVVWFTARGQGRVILRAKWDAIKGLPQAWAKRKKIQASRVATVREIWRVLDKRLIPSRRGR
jgi:GT2 family glycosyltransferase